MIYIKPGAQVGWSDKARIRFHRFAQNNPYSPNWSACGGTYLMERNTYANMPAEIRARLSPCPQCWPEEKP